MIESASPSINVLSVTSSNALLSNTVSLGTVADVNLAFDVAPIDIVLFAKVPITLIISKFLVVPLQE